MPEVPIPLIVGGRPDAALRRAGRLGDGWLGIWVSARAKAQVAPVMEGFYHVPFSSFERYVPAGTPADVAEQVAPYIEAGCTTLNFIPFAGSDEAGIDAVAEVRQALGLDV